jgi:hypothetical protein
MSGTIHNPTQLLKELEGIELERLAPEAVRRFRCVWMRFALGMPAPRIAESLHLNPSTVRHVHSAFMREGAKAILGRGNRGGRRRQNMTIEEECAFLHNHAAFAYAMDIRSLQHAYEKRVGKRVDASTIRSLLKRHGWRKTMGLSGTASREGNASAAGHACWSIAG